MSLMPCLLACALLLAAPTVETSRGSGSTDLLAIVDARAGLAGVALWPDWSPLDHPLAVSDGETTLLVSHPSPPDDFAPLPGHAGVFARPGRHPLVTANSSIDLGGVATATLLIAPEDPRPPRELAALVAHEAFHVLQGLRHPDWIADESQLFLLPVTDGDLLGLRRLESLALARALTAPDEAAAASWAARALALRLERDDRRSDGAAGYERGLELREGLARYVEHIAGGGGPLPFPEGGWPAEAARERAYLSGAALALLLDRLAPGWQPAFDQEGGSFLDDRLDDELVGVEPAVFGADEREATLDRAREDAEAVAGARLRAAQAFASRPGPAVQVVVGGGPVLSPQRFDPLNVRLLDGRTVLHSRLLQLERPGASIEVLGTECLTEGAGSHPLFGGVRAVLFTGLPEGFEPAIDGDTARMEAPGIEALLTGAEVERDPGRPFWRITLR